jgi:hypothetical protein
VQNIRLIRHKSDPGTLMDFALNDAEQLHGLSLIEGFQKFVLKDPEVVALSMHVLAADKRHAAIFRDGQAPGPFVDFHWPLDPTASAIAFQFVSSPIIFVDDPVETPSPAILAVSEALADRIARLRNLLASGEITAFGTYVLSGLEMPIGPHQWTRSDISIDVSKGDLCDGQDYRAVPKWTGLSLRLPDVQLTANQSQNAIASKAADVPHKARELIQTKENCRVECLAWLVGMMSDPKIVPRSREDLWAEAKLKWLKKLSKRAFLKARDDAIASTNALAWKLPGRKRKSSQS